MVKKKNYYERRGHDRSCPFEKKENNDFSKKIFLVIYIFEWKLEKKCNNKLLEAHKQDSH